MPEIRRIRSFLREQRQGCTKWQHMMKMLMSIMAALSLGSLLFLMAVL